MLQKGGKVEYKNYVNNRFTEVFSVKPLEVLAPRAEPLCLVSFPEQMRTSWDAITVLFVSRKAIKGASVSGGEGLS